MFRDEIASVPKYGMTRFIGNVIYIYSLQIFLISTRLTSFYVTPNLNLTSTMFSKYTNKYVYDICTNASPVLRYKFYFYFFNFCSSYVLSC